VHKRNGGLTSAQSNLLAARGLVVGLVAVRAGDDAIRLGSRVGGLVGGLPLAPTKPPFRLCRGALLGSIAIAIGDRVIRTELVPRGLKEGTGEVSRHLIGLGGAMVSTRDLEGSSASLTLVSPTSNCKSLIVGAGWRQMAAVKNGRVVGQLRLSALGRVTSLPTVSGAFAII
jgi:hypothetical protein